MHPLVASDVRFIQDFVTKNAKNYLVFFLFFFVNFIIENGIFRLVFSLEYENRFQTLHSECVLECIDVRSVQILKCG